MISESHAIARRAARRETVFNGLPMVLRLACPVLAWCSPFLMLGVAEVRAQARLSAPLSGPSREQTGRQLPTSPEAPMTQVGTLQYEAVPATADAVIEQMSEAAGVIFAGQVIAVRRPAGYMGSAQDAAEGVVEIDFRVVRALRGPMQGSVYTLREWSGLWAGNVERFRVGRQLLLFLRSPDASGLSSPVHGADGAIPLRGGGIPPGPDDTTAAAAEWLVDLRWVETRTLRRNGMMALPVREPVRRGGPQPYGQPHAQRYGQPDGPYEPYDRSALVRRIPAPGLPPAASGGETEPLSQVLPLCMNAMRTPHVPVR